MTPIPRVALVGRPNVGKSTLFNRICGRRQAITDGRPGSTRDRNYALANWRGSTFELIDTGGLLLATSDPLLGPAADQAQRAIEEADLVVLLVDGRAGLLPDDAAIARRLRRDGKRVLLAVNKQESEAQDTGEFTALGFEPVLSLSAEHGLGVGELLDAVVARIPVVEEKEDAERPVSIALVGRPNVGKSSLLNRLVGQERAVVSAVPGTTRDAVDSVLVRHGRSYRFVDTAGIRRQRLLKENVDHVSVVQARRSLERADVAVLVLDAESGLRELDATVGGYAKDAGRAIVLAVNKWDVATTAGTKQARFEQLVRDELKFLGFAPTCFISARTGRGLNALWKAIDQVYASARARVTTGQLNRVLMRAQQAYAPKAAKGAADLKILFGAQIGTAPPTFLLSLNHPVNLHFSYLRYLENQLRSAFGFEGAPIVFKVKTRRH